MTAQFQLFAFTPGSDTPTILPAPLSWQASFVLSDVGSLTIDYPRGAPGISVLDGYCDVEVRYLSGTSWICPPQGRFSVVTVNADFIGERNTPVRRYTCQSYGWLLRSVLQEQSTGLDASGNRPFPSASVAGVTKKLIDEAHAAGSIPNLTFVNSSTGATASPAYPFGKQLFDILGEARDQGLCDWLIQPDGTGQGRVLKVYDAVGVDRSTGLTPVVLRDGVDLTAAPSAISILDLAARALIAGDAGHTLKMSNGGAATPYGLLPTLVAAGGLTDVAALQIAGQARLDRGAGKRAQHTRAIQFATTTFLPFIAYGLGDTVLGPDGSGTLAPLRVRQITLTSDAKGVAGNLVLGDRFTEREDRLARLVKQLGGGAGAISGAGRPPAPAATDKRAPKAPTGLSVGSTPYTDPDGAYKALASIGWVNPTQASDGSAMDPVSTQVWCRAGTSGTWKLLTTVDFPATSVQWSPWDAGSVWQFRLRSLSVNGVAGAYSSASQVTMAMDTTAPPQPSPPTVITRLGTMTVSWDGRGSANEVMPADFAYAELHMSTTSGYTSSDATLIAKLPAPGFEVITSAGYYSSRFFKLVTVDRAGNRSWGSAQVTGSTKPLVNTDIIGEVISGANIVNGSINAVDKVLANSITGGLIRALTIQAGAIAANAITADKIQAGAISAVKLSATAIDGKVITGANIRTRASGARVEVNSGGLTFWDSTGGRRALLRVFDDLVYFQSSGSGARFEIDSRSGISLFNATGHRTVLLNANTGDASFKGTVEAGTAVVSPTITGGTVTSSNIRTSANYPRTELTTGGLTFYDSSGHIRALFRNSDNLALIRSASSGARFELRSDTGFSLYNSAGTRTVWLNPNGNATFTGTVTASSFLGGNINSAAVYGGTVNSAAGTGNNWNGGRLSNSVVSGGQFAGSITNAGVLTGGVFRNSGGGNRTQLVGNGLELYSAGVYQGRVWGGASAATLAGTVSALLEADTYRVQVTSTGYTFIDAAYHQTTSSSPNMVVTSTGLLARSTSSRRYKADIRPVKLDKTILALPTVSWRARKSTIRAAVPEVLSGAKAAAWTARAESLNTERYVGFVAEDAAALGLTQLVGYDDQGQPDSFSYDRVAPLHNLIIAEHDTRLDAIEAQLAKLTGAAR